MSTEFNIKISASDKASAIIQKINKNLSGLDKPLQVIGKQTASLGKDDGLEKYGKGISDISSRAANAAKEVANIISPMNILTGAGSIAGIVLMAKRWGDAGSEIGRTSKMIGGSTDDLQRYRVAAKMAGISVEALTGGLSNIGKTMRDAQYGGNDQARNLFSRLGVDMKKTKDGAYDVFYAMDKIHDVISKMDGSVQTKTAAAMAMGATAEMMPILLATSAEYAKFKAEIDKTNSVMGDPSLKAANELRQAFTSLGEAIDGVGNKMMGKLAKPMVPILNGLRDNMSTVVESNYNKQFPLASAIIHLIGGKKKTGQGASGSWDNGSSGSWGGGASGFWGDKETPASKDAKGPSREKLLDLVRRLEGSGDNAVSPKGAIGRYQIMPGTARQYGLDPAKLYDPAYNKMAASTILDDLNKRYNGDTDAILAGYNGGPGRANAFLKSGRDPSVLPVETQNYLNRAHGMTGDGSQGVGGNPAPGGGSVKVEVSFVNAPPGMRANVKPSGSVTADTKIAYSLQPGAL